MVSYKLTIKEIALFLLVLAFSFCLLPKEFGLVWTIFFLSFVAQRKVVYFLWSIISSRITGSAPILEYVLSLAREEGPGGDRLNDLLEIKIPFGPRLFFIFKDSYIRKVMITDTQSFPALGEGGAMKQIMAHSDKNILLNPGSNPDWKRYRTVTSKLNRDRFGATSTVAQMFELSWKSMQKLSLSYFSEKCDQDLILFKELFEVVIPTHNCALFGEEAENKYRYSEMASDVFDVLTETGTQLKFNYCPPWLRTAHAQKSDRITATVRNMMNASNSALLKPLFEAREEGIISEEELLSNVMVFEYAQAPLHAIFWVLYLLAIHPEEDEKLAKEIREVISHGEITYERLSEFEYVSKVVQESLRLYPGVGLQRVRVSKEDTQLGEHYVPKDSLILMCTYAIQRNASYWALPDKFDPLRAGIDEGTYGHNLTYIPFGAGPRQCQGKFFATDFVKVCVITLLQHFKIALAPGQAPPVPTELGYLRPVYPVAFRFTKRI